MAGPYQLPPLPEEEEEKKKRERPYQLPPLSEEEVVAQPEEKGPYQLPPLSEEEKGPYQLPPLPEEKPEPWEHLPPGVQGPTGEPVFTSPEGEKFTPGQMKRMILGKGEEVIKLGLDPVGLRGPYFAETRENAAAYSEAGLSWVPYGKLLEELQASGELGKVQTAVDEYSKETLRIVSDLKRKPLRVGGYTAKAKKLLREQGQPPIEYVQLPDGSIVPDYNDKETREWLLAQREKEKAETLRALAGVQGRDGPSMQRYLALALPPLQIATRLEDMPAWKNARVGEDVPTYVPASRDRDGKVIEEATVKMLPKKEGPEEDWVDLFNAAQTAKGYRENRKQQAEHFKAVNRTADRVFKERAEQTFESMVREGAYARGLGEMRMTWGPFGRQAGADVDDPWFYYEGFARAYYGMYSIPQQFLAKAFPNVFGSVDIDPNETYWNWTASVGSLLGSAVDPGYRRAKGLVSATLDIVELSLTEWLPSGMRGVLGFGEHFVTGRRTIFDDVEDSMAEFAWKNADVMMPLMWEAARQQGVRVPEGLGYIDQRRMPSQVESAFEWNKAVKNTMLEIPGAAVVAVHLVRGLGQVASYWSDPNIDTETKLKASGDLLGQMGDHLGHRYKMYFKDPAAVFNEGAFKVFLDILMAADIAMLPARIMASRAISSARLLAEAETNGLRQMVESAEMLMKEARAMPTKTHRQVAERAIAIDEARLTMDKAKYTKPTTEAMKKATAGLERAKAMPDGKARNLAIKEATAKYTKASREQGVRGTGRSAFEAKQVEARKAAAISAAEKAVKTAEQALKDAKAMPRVTKVASWRAEEGAGRLLTRARQLLGEDVVVFGKARKTAVESAKAQLKSAKFQLKDARAGRSALEVTDDILLEERVHLSADEKEFAATLVAQNAEVSEAIKTLNELLKGKLDGLNNVVNKNFHRTNNRMLRHEKTLEAGEAFNVNARGSGRQILDTELKLEWKRTKSALSRARKKGKTARVAELEAKLRDIRVRQHELDKLAVPDLAQQIDELQGLIYGKAGEAGIVELLFTKMAHRKALRHQARQVSRQRRTAIRQAGIPKRARDLANDGKALSDMADFIRQSAMYSLPVFGQLALANRGIHWILDGPGSIGIPGLFKVSKVRARAWWYDRNNRLADAWQTGMREADGAAGEFVYRVAERLRNVKEADWPILRDMLKYEHDHITRLYSRDPYAVAGQKYSLRNPLPVMPGERLAATADSLPWEMTREEYIMNHARLTPEAAEAALETRLGGMFADGSKVQVEFSKGIRGALRDGTIEGYVDDFIAASSKEGGKQPFPIMFESTEAAEAVLFRENFLDQIRSVEREFAVGGGQFDISAVRHSHFKYVESAIYDMKPIHPEVLDAYPSLQKALVAEQAMIQRRLEVMNRHDDIVDLLIEVNKSARDSRAIYAPGKERTVYYPEAIEKVWDTLTARIESYKGEWVGNPTLKGAADEIATMASRIEDQAIGIAIMENTWRRMGFSVTEREAGFLTSTGERVRVARDLPGEMLGKLPLAVRDFEFLKAFNKLRTDSTVHRPFVNADRIAALKEQIWTTQTARKLNPEQQAKALKSLRAELSELEAISRDPWSIARAEKEIAMVQRNPKLKPAVRKKQLKVAKAKLEDARIRESLKEQGWVEIGPNAEKATRGRGDHIIAGKFVISPGQKVKGIINRPIGKTGSYEMGNLRGMIHGDIAQELYGAYKMTSEYSNFGIRALNWFKGTKTILSGGTHVTNWLGNFLYLAPMAGISPWNPANWKYFKLAAKDFASKTKSPQFLRWVKAGGRGPAGGINRSELLVSTERGVGMLYQGIFGTAQQAHRNMARMVKGTFTGDLHMAFGGATGGWRHLQNLPKGMYQMGDDYFRYTLFLKKVDKVGAWTKASRIADARGAIAGRRAFADYENLNGLFQTVRRGWWGQVFIAFDARTTPLVFKTLQESPYAISFALAVHDHMSTQNMVDSGFDPHMADYALESIPDYAKFSKTWLMSIFPLLKTLELKDTALEGMRINFLKYFPGGRRLPFIKGETMMQYLGRAFMSDNPWLSTYMHTQNVDPFYRGSIYKEGIGGDSPELAAERILERIRMTWLPPDSFGLGYGYREIRVERARRGEIPYGRLQPRSLLKEQLGRWAGLDVGIWDMEKLMSTGDMSTANEMRKLRIRARTLAIKAERKQVSIEDLERESIHWNRQWAEFLERTAKRSVLKDWIIKNHPEITEPELPEIEPEQLKIIETLGTEETTPRQIEILEEMSPYQLPPLPEEEKK